MLALPYQLTKTLLCALNEEQGITDVDRRHFANTTLNYKYNNRPDDIPTDTPKVAYFGIGIKGFKNLDDGNLAAPFVPSSSNMDLFEPVPFRVVPVESDLTPTERSKYRMRILRTIGGQDYWCYYLKKISIVDNQVKIIRTNLTTGVEVEVSDLDPNNLTPTPNNTSAEGSVTSTDKISVALTANLQITGAEVIEAIGVLYSGNLLKANISELGIYTGEDKDIVASDGIGGSLNIVESIYTQLAYHYTSLGTPFINPSRIENIKMRINSASAFLV